MNGTSSKQFSNTDSRAANGDDLLDITSHQTPLEFSINNGAVGSLDQETQSKPAVRYVGVQTEVLCQFSATLLVSLGRINGFKLGYAIVTKLFRYPILPCMVVGTRS